MLKQPRKWRERERAKAKKKALLEERESEAKRKGMKARWKGVALQHVESGRDEPNRGEIFWMDA